MRLCGFELEKLYKLRLRSSSRDLGGEAMEFRSRLERLKIRFIVWVMLTFRLRPRALPGFDAVKMVQEEREDRV
jgi:hypothetical protein